MFTGIVEEIGLVEKVEETGNTLFIEIKGKKVMEDLKPGDSVAVNGVCLTVAAKTIETFQVDIMPETFKSTSLSSLKRGAYVNLERAMAAGERFGGHFVTGHVDGIGTIIRRVQKENAIYLDISYPSVMAPWMLLKGSVALDGTSLTIFGLKENCLTVSLIPHTASHTVLGMKKTGDFVNIECDVVLKYLHAYASRYFGKQHPKISVDFLKEHGFLE